MEMRLKNHDRGILNNPNFSEFGLKLTHNVSCPTRPKLYSKLHF